MARLSVWLKPILHYFFPERLLRDSAWEFEWREQTLRSLVLRSRYCSLAAGIVWLLHYPFFDMNVAGGPSAFWLQIRLSLFLLSVGCALISFWPRFATSKLFYLAPIITGWTYCLIETRAMLWSDKVILVYPFVFLFMSVILLRVNLFWSLSYACAILASLWPTFVVSHPNQELETFSMATLCLLCIYFHRSNSRDDVLSFLNVRKLAKAEQTVLVKELELTGAVQKLLLPKHSEVNETRFQLGAKFIPAAQSAGDWWWMHQEGDFLRVMIGDVTGHGAGPAMITASTTSLVRGFYDPAQPFENLLTKLERHYYSMFKDSQYWMTVSAAEIDLNSLHVRAWFAGGPPIFVYSNSGKPSTIGCPGRPLGSNAYCFQTVQTELTPGSRLVFASDGIYEQRVEAMMRPMPIRMLNDLLKNEQKDPSAFVAAEKIVDALKIARGRLPQEDDYTLVIIDLKNPATGAKLAG